MARQGALLFAAAAVVTAIGLVAPHQEQVEETGLAAVAAVAAFMAAVLRLGQRHIPEWAYPVVISIGSALISFALLFNGERTGGAAGGDEAYYLWVTIYAAHYLGRAGTAMVVGFIAVAYALTLVAIDPGPIATSRWLTTVGLVIGAAIVIRLLTERAERLVRELGGAARTDGLTGLANRRGFEERFRQEAARVPRGSEPFAVLLADLDNFKEVNDRSGHAAGDATLIDVAAVLQSELREIDTTARIGGDEFGVLLPGATRDAALLVGLRLARAVQAREVEAGQRVSLSFGVAVYGTDGGTLDEVMHAADEALYEEKRKRTGSGTRRKPVPSSRAG